MSWECVRERRMRLVGGVECRVNERVGWRLQWKVTWNSGNYSNASHRSRKRPLGYVNEDGGMYLEQESVVQCSLIFE